MGVPVLCVNKIPIRYDFRFVWSNVAITVLAYKEALLFGRAKRAAYARTPERAAKLRGAKELSRLPSRATRACTCHDIPQMESWLAGYYCTLLLVKGSNV